MTNLCKPILILACMSLLAPACATTGSGSKDESANADTSNNTKKPKKRGETLEAATLLITQDDFDASKYQKRDNDLNKDNVVDVTEYFTVKDDVEVLARKEVDVNFDKKFDVIRTFNPKRQLIMERMDTDFDGVVDVVSIFEAAQLVRKEYDTNFDKLTDLWRFFEDGNIVKKEADLDYDGDVDYWEYFEAGKIDRVGIDRDSDGEVDDWELALPTPVAEPEPAAAPAAEPATAAPAAAEPTK
jgi:hypothetical protein